MITASVLGEHACLRHGFMTRLGGVSEGLYASLNCGFGSGDEALRVGANRQRALARLGAPGAALVTAYQVHGTTAAYVETPWAPADAPRADALITDRPGIALGVLTADCAPLLMADAEAGVVGAVHAGWRGARAGVVEAAVGAMTGLGARIERIRAAIGPCIGWHSYEVGPEFRRDFLEDDDANADFFAAAPRDGHYLFDLSAYVARRLERLAPAAVEPLGLDTYADEDRFFSYRRTVQHGGGDYGRALSAIVLGD